MDGDFRQKLEDGFEELYGKSQDQDYLGFIIIENSGMPGKFFQYQVDRRGSNLDFPVTAETENTVDERDRLTEVAENYKEEVERGPAGGDGIQISLGPDTDLVKLSERLINEIWDDCESISVETGI